MDPELTVGLLAARFDDEYPDAAPEWVAARAVRNIRASERTTLLAALLTERIEARRRARSREVERQAALSSQWAENERRSQATQAEYLLQHAANCQIIHRGYGNGYYAAVACDERKRKASPEGLAASAEWKRRREETRQRRLDEAAREELRLRDPEEYDRLYPSPWVMLTRAMEDYRDRVRLDLTIELLGSQFALGDGRTTTWGRASIEDHEQRIAVLMQGIEGSGRTIVLHEKAIELLEARSAACLNDVRFAA